MDGLATTWQVMLCHPTTPGENFHFATGEYTSREAAEEWLTIAYGGWYADPRHHRIVRIRREIELRTDAETPCGTCGHFHDWRVSPHRPAGEPCGDYRCCIN